MSKRMNGLEMLRQDHRQVQQMLQRCEKAKSEQEQRQLTGEILQMLKLHAQLEEEVFYPYVRDTTGQLFLVEEATVEHTAAKGLMRELETNGAEPLHQRAVLHVLGEYLRHHIREEEEEIFPLVEKTGVDLEALGLEMMEQREMLQGGRREGRRHQASTSRSGADPARRASRSNGKAQDMTKEGTRNVPEPAEAMSDQPEREDA